jgi:hypothetical protein
VRRRVRVYRGIVNPEAASPKGSRPGTSCRPSWRPAGSPPPRIGCALPVGTLIAGCRNVRRTPSASTRRTRCYLSNRSTAGLRRCTALAGWEPRAKGRETGGSEIIGYLWHLRVIPPQLLMDAVAQPEPVTLAAPPQGVTTRAVRSEGERNRCRSEPEPFDIPTLAPIPMIVLKALSQDNEYPGWTLGPPPHHMILTRHD